MKNLISSVYLSFNLTFSFSFNLTLTFLIILICSQLTMANIYETVKYKQMTKILYDLMCCEVFPLFETVNILYNAQSNYQIAGELCNCSQNAL